MSHYAVAVFSEGENFDKLLAPYSESDERYFVFEKADYNELLEDYERFREKNNDMSMEQYLDLEGYIQRNGEWGYMHNPRGYWDWYNIDGKDYMFDLKPKVKSKGRHRKNDYEWFEQDEDYIETANEFWDKYIATDANGDPPSFFNRKYYLERYKTKEQYVKERSRTVPYAFITPDGEWHAPGRVGWFACSDDTAESYNRYVEEWDNFLRSKGNPYVSLVDCHI